MNRHVRRYGYRIAMLLLAAAVCAGSMAFALTEDLGVVIGGKLHLRAGPRTDAALLGTYESGTHVRVTGVEGTWYQVEVTDGATGYMEAAYIYITSKGVVENGDRYVNLRSAPSREASVIGRYRSGTMVTLLDENTTGWCQVDIGGMRGYMAAYFIKAAPEGGGSLPMVPPFYDSGVNPYVLQSFPGQDATHQVGQPQTESRDDGALQYTIHYPALSIPSADSAIRTWIDGILAEAEQAIAASEEGVQMDITVSYDAYLIDNRYVGVLERGFADGMTFAHPWEKAFTVNVDAQTGQLLTPTDIFLPGRLNEAVLMLHDKLAQLAGNPVEGVFMDTSWLQHMLLTPQGIAIVLPKGEFIASAWGTQSVLLPYGELTGLLAIDIGA